MHIYEEKFEKYKKSLHKKIVIVSLLQKTPLWVCVVPMFSCSTGFSLSGMSYNVISPKMYCECFPL